MSIHFVVFPIPDNSYLKLSAIIGKSIKSINNIDNSEFYGIENSRHFMSINSTIAFMTIYVDNILYHNSTNITNEISIFYFTTFYIYYIQNVKNSWQRLWTLCIYNVLNIVDIVDRKCPQPLNHFSHIIDRKYPKSQRDCRYSLSKMVVNYNENMFIKKYYFVVAMF